MSRNNGEVIFDFGKERLAVELTELMTPDDMASLRDLARDARVAVNVGAFTGASAAAILEAMAPDGVCYSIDTLRGTPGDYPAQMGPPLIVSCFLARTAPFGSRSRLYIGESVEFAALFPKATADLVFIDAAHAYASCRADIEAWLPALKPGGIMAGHDIEKEMLGIPLELLAAHVDEEMWEGMHPGVLMAVRESFRKVNLSRSLDSTVWWVRV